MSNVPVPPRRAPRKKLKMPLFGGMGGGASAGESANRDDFFGKNFGSILIAMTGMAFAAQIFLPNIWSEKVYNEADEITEMAWNGTIRKKYTDAKHKSEIHYYLVIKGEKGKKQIVDLVEADPVFFDQIAVPQRVKKAANSLDVRVQRFTKPDTTLRIKFIE
ncbi:MAG: hypothetical protein RL422_540 [Bacteroidota bacterium]|jgi:hypothetical protein